MSQLVKVGCPMPRRCGWLKVGACAGAMAGALVGACCGGHVVSQPVGVAVVVVGEKPYAEMQGDRKDLKLDKEDLDVIKRFKENDIPVVVVLLSGRPMIITDEIEKWDGLIAAWLPGTEGSGVADVLFGDYNPTGKLSFSWPKNMNQFPINPEDDHLYSFGFGLSY